MLFQVLVHRAGQMLSSKDDLDNWYHTLAHFRNAASHCQTYEGSMQKVKVYIWKYQQDLDGGLDGAAAPITFNNPQRRSVRRQVYEIQGITQQVSFDLTPQKRKKDGANIALKKEQDNCCLGMSLVCRVKADADTGAIKSDARVNCSLCEEKTAMYCTGCSRFFCINKTRLKQLKDKGVLQDEDANTTTVKLQRYNVWLKKPNEDAWTRRSCYHIAHEKAWV
jgi:hypothetical protein